MESNDARSSRLSSYPSRKRRPSRESNSSRDRHEIRAETMDGCLELPGNYSPQLLNQLNSKNRELELRIDDMYAEFKTMKYLNRDLKSEVQHLQQQYDRLVSQNRELELRIKTMNQGAPRSFNLEQHSRKIQPRNPDIEDLVENFKERCDLVESDNQELTERLDSCQQNVLKMQVKNDDFEKQLTNLQQHLDNFEIHDENVPHDGAITTQRLTQEDARRNLFVADKTELLDSMNTEKEQFDNNNDGCTLIEETLCTPCENQIMLSTDEIQYGIFDVCDKYNVILLKETDKLKLFDHQEKIDERQWGELGHSNYVTCIHWCSFLDTFLILYRFGLYTLSLRLNQETSKMEFDQLTHIHSIRVYSLKYGTTNQLNKAVEILRFISTSPNLPDYLFLNRGYRRIELMNTNSWKVLRGWSKQDLDYGERDEIRLITCSYDGSYLAMNIRWNDYVWFIDLRKHDGQMTLMKRIRMPNDSLLLLHKIQVPFDQEKWLLVAHAKHQWYTVSSNPHDKKIIPMRTDHVQRIENVSIHLRFVRNHKYLLVGTVIGNSGQKHGVLSFHKCPAR